MATKLDDVEIKSQIEYLKRLTDTLPTRYDELRHNPLDFNGLFEYVGIVARTVDFLAIQHIDRLTNMLANMDDGK